MVSYEGMGNKMLDKYQGKKAKGTKASKGTSAPKGRGAAAKKGVKKGEK